MPSPRSIPRRIQPKRRQFHAEQATSTAFPSARSNACSVLIPLARALDHLLQFNPFSFNHKHSETTDPCAQVSEFHRTAGGRLRSFTSGKSVQKSFGQEMNCEVFYLKELEVEHYQIREVLRCILHTIMFNRALGLVRPRDVDSELFEITYVQCGDSATEKKIEEKIDHFLSWVEKYPNKKSRVCLSFYETRNKHMAWFSKVERLYWEQWCIQLQVVPPAPLKTKKFYDSAQLGDTGETVMDERQRRHATLEAALREVITQVLLIVNEKKDHIPPVQQPDVVISFPFEISIPSSSDSSFGMDVFKRLLQTGPPTMLN